MSVVATGHAVAADATGALGAASPPDAPWRASAARRAALRRCSVVVADLLSLSDLLGGRHVGQAARRVHAQPARLDSARIRRSSTTGTSCRQGQPRAEEQPDHCRRRDAAVDARRQPGRLQPGAIQHRRHALRLLAPLAADDAAGRAWSFRSSSSCARSGKINPALGLDSHAALIALYTVFNLPFVIWMMRSLFRSGAGRDRGERAGRRLRPGSGRSGASRCRWRCRG